MKAQAGRFSNVPISCRLWDVHRVFHSDACAPHRSYFGDRLEVLYLRTKRQKISLFRRASCGMVFSSSQLAISSCLCFILCQIVSRRVVLRTFASRPFTVLSQFHLRAKLGSLHSGNR